jgi:teichuronic acid biosynthesis glycosyltransferase TuaH
VPRTREGGARPAVALVSLEPWDDVWRRNQHLSDQLVRGGWVGAIDFLEPPRPGVRPGAAASPTPGIRTVPLALRVPKRVGGLAELGARLRRGILRRADVLWVNDPALGVHCLRHGQPVVYDVTDDWRSYDFPPRILRRIIRAEDELARRARTVVCSTTLRDRWGERYGVEPAVVHNGVDTRAWAGVDPHVLPGPAPRVGYVGTLQSERLDIDLVVRTADAEQVGSLHLIGPDALDPLTAGRLRSHPKITVHGPVPASAVPAWTSGLDVLLSPHRVTPFTLSLDAIKSYEYMASGRPVVATPTSGFQLLGDRAGVRVATSGEFVPAVVAALHTQEVHTSADDLDWSGRAREFADQLDAELRSVR